MVGRLQARLDVAAGHGGAGCVSIWKSSGKGKFQPADGGNGGRGGDIVVEACPRLADLPALELESLPAHSGSVLNTGIGQDTEFARAAAPAACSPRPARP